MAQLADTLAQMRANEIAQSEAAIASCFPPPPQVSPETQQRLAPFLAWCEMQKVRAVPARPQCVAAYVQYQQDQGISRQLIAERLEAIADLHNAASMGNPCATPVVRTVTGGSTIEPPRSWDKESKIAFTELPVEIQAVIAKREHDRERELRKSHNIAGDLRQELKRLRAEAANAAHNTTTESETTMAKKEKGVGPYAGVDKDSTPRREDKNSWERKDISRVVDKGWQENDGFAGKLPEND